MTKEERETFYKYVDNRVDSLRNTFFEHIEKELKEIKINKSLTIELLDRFRRIKERLEGLSGVKPIDTDEFDGYNKSVMNLHNENEGTKQQ